MNVVSMSTDNNWDTFEIFANSTQVSIKLFFECREDKGLSVLCTKDNVNVIFNKRLGHNGFGFCTTVIEFTNLFAQQTMMSPLQVSRK